MKPFSILNGLWAFAIVPLFLAMMVLPSISGAAVTNVISWNFDNNSTVGDINGSTSGNQAGVVLVPNWANSYQANPTVNLMDNSSNATTLDISYTSASGSWSIGGHPGVDADGSYNKEMLNGYLNGSAPAGTSITLSQIPYTTYDIYVYFGSDDNTRSGTVTDGTTTYSFGVLDGMVAGANALFVRTTDTGTGFPEANYAIFTNRSGATKTISTSFYSANHTTPNFGGIAGFQIVDKSLPANPVTNYVWSGSGGDNNWSTGLNWFGGTAPVAANLSALTFQGGTRTSPNMNASYQVTDLTISNNASGFTFGTANASTLQLKGSVTNDSGSAQTFNVPITLIGFDTRLNAAAGNLVLNSNINMGSSDLTLEGNNNITLANVTGTGTFAKTGAGSLTVTGTNISAGRVTFNNGTTTINNGTVVGSGSGVGYVGYTTGNGLLNLQNSTLRMGGPLRVGGSDVNGSGPNGTGTLNISGSTVGVGELGVAWGNDVLNTVSGSVTVSGGSTFVCTNDVTLGFAGTGLGQLTIDGSTFIIGPNALKWFTVGQYDFAYGQLDINSGGNLKLYNNSSLKMCRGNSIGLNTINLNGGNVTFYSDAGTTVGGGGNLDMNLGGSVSSIAYFNLNGGTLTVPSIIASVTDSDFIEFHFNGGTLKAAATSATFMQGVDTVSVQGGGAVIDTAGFNMGIVQVLTDGGGGGLTKMGNGTLTLLLGYSYSGPTVVQGGTLALDAAQSSSASALTVNGAALNLSLNNGSSSVNAGNVTLNNAVLNFNFGTATSPTAAGINANGFTVSATGTNIINITGPGLAQGQYPLISTGGSVSTNNFRLGNVGGISATLVNSGTSLDLLISEAGASLTWYGADASNNPLTTWDINTSSNWNGGAAKYMQYGGNTYGDSATFNDSVFAGSTNVNLSARVVPSAVQFSGSQTYSITGAGGIDGLAALNVAGGSVFLGTSNGFTGGTLLNNATLTITNDSALGSSVGSLTLQGGTLRLNGPINSTRPYNLEANTTISVQSGSTATLNGPISGAGGLIKTNLGTLALAGNVTSGGEVRLTSGTTTVSAGVTNTGVLWVGSGVDLNGSMNVQGSTAMWVGDYLVVGGNGGTGVVSQISGTTVTVANNDAEIGGASGSGSGTWNMSGGSLTARIITLARGVNNVSTVRGLLNMTGGTASSRQWFTLGFAGNASNTATITNSGGTINVKTVGPDGFLEMGVFDATENLFVMNSGSVNLQNNAGIGFGQGGNHTGNSTFIHNGGAVTFYSDGGVTVGGTGALNLGNGGSTGVYAYNLNGGTLTVPQIQKVSGGASGAFNFNGGTLKAATTNASFMQGLTAANVQAGGAIIDSDGKDITIDQALIGAGGVTKNGAGTLVLSGANTYNGNTVVNTGILELAQPTLSSNSTVSISSGAQLRQSFTGTNTVNSLTLNGVGQPAGVYNNANTPTYFLGGGNLLVLTGGDANPIVTFSVSGGTTLTLAWPPSYLGWVLQSQTNSLNVGISTNWYDVPGSGSVTNQNIPLNPANPTVYYRLRSP